MTEADNITPALDRLCRSYQSYLADTSKDSLFNLLNALHSLEERVESTHGRLFFGVPEYAALKAFRNLEQHNVEVKYVVFAKTELGAVISDLLFACLVSIAQREQAIKETKEKYRQQARDAFEQVSLEYGPVLDINHIVFNCVVRMYEILKELGYSGTSPEYEALEQSYGIETDQGYSHYVDGRVSALAGDAQRVVTGMWQRYEAG